MTRHECRGLSRNTLVMKSVLFFWTVILLSTLGLYTFAF